MATFQGKGHIFGMGTATFIPLQSDGSTAVSGYITPNQQGVELKHNGSVDRIVSQTGEFTGLIAHGEFLEATFDFIPEGASGAQAKTAATLPVGCYGVKITGLPIIACGSFTDAYNTDGGNTQPWFYEYEGTITASAENKWVGKITLRRYPSITSAAVIS